MWESTGTLAKEGLLGLLWPEIFEGDLMTVFLYLHGSFQDGKTRILFSGTYWEDKKHQRSQTKRVQDGYKDVVFFL